MGKYGKTAKLAVRAMQKNPNYTPQIAWKNAAMQTLHTKSAREKGCPKNAFLGLCEEGIVNGIPAGSYTNSLKNKNYALTALSLLQENPTNKADQNLLWEEVMGGESKVQNQQMDVVISLFEAGLIG